MSSPLELALHRRLAALPLDLVEEEVREHPVVALLVELDMQVQEVMVEVLLAMAA